MIRIKQGIDYDAFLDAVLACKGEVSLKSPDVYLNLKSSLCRFFALNQVFTNANVDVYKDVKLEIEKPEDVLKLLDYIEDDGK